MIFGNRSFAGRAREVGLDVAVAFEDGAHDWDFWDRHLQKFFVISGDNALDHIVIEHRIRKEDEGKYLSLPFDVPEEVEGVTVSLSISP